MQHQTVQRDRSAGRPIGTTVAYAIVFCACLVGTVAHGQERPPDVARASIAPAPTSLVLPTVPKDFERTVRGPVEWHTPRAARNEADFLASTLESSWERIRSDFGRRIDPRVTIRIARDPAEMRALAPRALPPPRYATGVAYPAIGLVLLTLSAPETWERPPLEAVLAHELSHIALYRAVEARPVPRWFAEGVAIHQAREQSFARTRVLWGASLGDTLIPVGRLSDAFSSKSHKVTLAYAQSADLVAYMRNERNDRSRFRALIGNVANRVPFSQAVERAYGRSLTEIERGWHAKLAQQYRAFPLLISGGTIWVFASVLIVVAYFRRKRKDRKTLQRWAAEEAAAAKVEETAKAPPQVSVLSSEEVGIVLDLSGDPPQGREAGVPTIQYEGRDHTLH